MKKKIKVYERGSYIQKEINYIPIRYIIAMMLAIIEILSILAVMIILAIYVPYFYVLMIITEIAVVISIIGSNENPDYKVPWLLFVITLPVVGFMLYFMFHERKLPKRFRNRLEKFLKSLKKDDSSVHEKLKKEDRLIASQAKVLCEIADTHLYQNTNLKYYPLGDDMHEDMLVALNNAKQFIFLEYFIIEEGVFWNSILYILKEKAANGVEVKIIYDDIGCMSTLPGNYYKQLKELNIEAVPFSKLKGSADGEFNNRSHRKILVIDGEVAFTGGINLADEYINAKRIYGHWKDTGIRLMGEAVDELTKLFLSDFYINIKKEREIDFNKYYLGKIHNGEYVDNYVIPFGDGPNPVYDKNVSKLVIMNILNQAKDYVYITTPYLIIDNELMKAIENTALRGVDVRLVVPHIPDKRLIFKMTQSNYQVLIASGVKVYEYEPGFIHAKQYIADDKFGMIGTINLDYRSLTHHFENGVWIYNDKIILEMKKDILDVIDKSIYMNEQKTKDYLITKLVRSIIRIFSPML